MKQLQTKAIAFLRTGGGTRDSQYKKVNKQWDVIEDYATTNKYKLVQCIDCFSWEDINLKLAELIEYCREYPEVKCVLVTTFDRIGRKTRSYIWWEKALKNLGVEIKSVYQPTNGLPLG